MVIHRKVHDGKSSTKEKKEITGEITEEWTMWVQPNSKEFHRIYQPCALFVTRHHSRDLQHNSITMLEVFSTSMIADYQTPTITNTNTLLAVDDPQTALTSTQDQVAYFRSLWNLVPYLLGTTIPDLRLLRPISHFSIPASSQLLRKSILSSFIRMYQWLTKYHPAISCSVFFVATRLFLDSPVNDSY